MTDTTHQERQARLHAEAIHNAATALVGAIRAAIRSDVPRSALRLASELIDDTAKRTRPAWERRIYETISAACYDARDGINIPRHGA